MPSLATVDQALPHTTRVVDDVVAQLAEWNRTGLQQRASINVSVRDLETPDLKNSITKALQIHDVPASQLTVEVTETALMAELREAQSTLRELADLGIAIALDDFGTGYSSMAHLRRLPVIEVKIDRSVHQPYHHRPRGPRPRPVHH